MRGESELQLSRNVTLCQWVIGSIELEETETAVAQWLRCCATNRKVACSIPDDVIGNISLT